MQDASYTSSLSGQAQKPTAVNSQKTMTAERHGEDATQSYNNNKTDGAKFWETLSQTNEISDQSASSGKLDSSDAVSEELIQTPQNSADVAISNKDTALPDLALGVAPESAAVPADAAMRDAGFETIKTAEATVNPNTLGTPAYIKTAATSFGTDTIFQADTAFNATNGTPEYIKTNVQLSEQVLQNTVFPQTVPTHDGEVLLTETGQGVEATDTLDTAAQADAAEALLTVNHSDGPEGDDALLSKIRSGTPEDVASLQESSRDDKAPRTDSFLDVDSELRLTSSDITDTELDKTSAPDLSKALTGLALGAGAEPSTLLETPQLSLQTGLVSTLGLSASGATLTPITSGATLGPNSVPIVNDAILLAKETSKGVTVRLDPPEMGRVYIDFSFDTDRQVSVVIKTESLDAQHLLQERSDEFLAMLSENGLGDANITFEFHDGQDSEGFDGTQSFADSESLGITDEPLAKPVDPRSIYARNQTYSDGLDLRL